MRKICFWYLYTFILVFIILQIIVILLHNNREPELTGWPKSKSRNLHFYIHFMRPLRTIPKSFCKGNNSIVVIVHSKVNNLDARNAIRATWGQPSMLERLGISLYFLIGEPIAETKYSSELEDEIKNSSDILQVNVVDSFLNSTLKTVFMLKLLNACRFIAFAIKTEDDVYLNLPNILLGMKNNTKMELLGKLIKEEPRNKTPESKRYSPKYMFDKPVYPDYLFGGGYLMTRFAFKELYRVAKDTKLFHLEDVFLTGICAEKAGLLRNDTLEHCNETLITRVNICEIFNTAIYQPCTPSEMQTRHSFLRDLKVPCILSNRIFISDGTYVPKF